MKSNRSVRKDRVIYDVLYGFIPITEWEEKIIDSPFFQRLRWTQQLGFSSFIFPGATHTRFAHVIGVMNSMDQMVRSLGLAVSDDELFSSKSRSEEALFHKSLRIAAMLHDIGTFPFSHVVEYAYLRHGNDHRRNKDTKKQLPNSHEHLGSFIIKNTNYPGGITHILLEYGFDPQLISDIIKGDSPYFVANQLMHSDLDADRMDYLLRDAHYTGLKYGQFDREFLISNLTTYQAGPNQVGFGVRENALHAVEDFLFARFSWYSQVIKNRSSAKFDVISAHLSKAFLEEDWIHQFHDLLQMIEDQDERFFWWNDIYFLRKCQEISGQKKIKDPKTAELLRMLLFRNPPKSVEHPLLDHRIVGYIGENDKNREKLLKQIDKLLKEFESVLKRYGTGKEWLISELPDKDVVFTKGVDQVMKKRTQENLLLERDPIRVVSKSGIPCLLVEKENSLMKHLSGYVNFAPNVYANEPALALLKKHKLIEP